MSIWPSGFPGDGLSDLARFLISREGIQAGDWVTGSSLGGMVACEISRFVDVGKVVLIGSAWGTEEINPLLGQLSCLARLLPLRLFQVMARYVVPGRLAAMFAAVDREFMRAMFGAMFSWEGDQGRERPFRIHGSRDSVIFCPVEVDVRIEGGGHLISMSHSEACVEALSLLADRSESGA
ncbi:MAG: hypothetical protein AAF514_24860 [Verrucomicrobiota bacterium]